MWKRLRCWSRRLLANSVNTIYGVERIISGTFKLMIYCTFLLNWMHRSLTKNLKVVSNHQHRGNVPANTLRNNNVVITSKRRHFDVITSKWRRFDVTTTLLLRHVFRGVVGQMYGWTIVSKNVETCQSYTHCGCLMLPFYCGIYPQAAESQWVSLGLGSVQFRNCIMTSSNGDIFRVTGP